MEAVVVAVHLLIVAVVQNLLLNVVVVVVAVHLLTAAVVQNLLLNVMVVVAQRMQNKYYEKVGLQKEVELQEVEVHQNSPFPLNWNVVGVHQREY